jgi:hypothetical protein
MSALASDVPEISSFPFFVSLMPFEKKLLECVVLADEQLRTELDLIQHDSEWKVRFLDQAVFPYWAPVIKVKKQLENTARELQNSSTSPPSNDVIIPEFTSHLRERAHCSFFASLHAPYNRNKFRAQLAQADNPDFVDNILRQPDLLRFLKSIVVSVNDVDLRSWEIIVAMSRSDLDNMNRWLLDVPRTLQLFEYVEAGFEIQNVVRMYCIHLVRPQVGPTILELFESHNDMGSKFWDAYQAEQKYRLKKRRKFFNSAVIRAFQRKEYASESLSSHLREDVESEADVSDIVSLSADSRIFTLTAMNSTRKL